MATQKLKVNRDILAKFLPDPRSIREFEKVFSTIDQNAEDQALLINDVSIVASGADSNAFLSLALLGALSQMAELGAIKPPEQTPENENHIDVPIVECNHNEMSINHNIQTSVDYIDFNQSNVIAEPNRLYINNGLYFGSSKIAYDIPFVITNNSAISIDLGDVVGLLGNVYQKYDATNPNIILIGVAVESIGILGSGAIAVNGVIPFNTVGFTIGTQLYASDTVSGGVSATGTQKIGIVTNINQILVRI